MGESLNRIHEITVTPAVKEDIAGLEAVRRAVWASTYPRVAPDYISQEDVESIFSNDRITEAITRGEAALLNPAVQILVAKDNDVVVGLSIAKKHSDALGEVLSLYVLDDYQGQGIGTDLMHTAMSWLEADKRTIRLEVIETNNKAITMYERLGFVFERKLPKKQPDPPLKYIPHIEMLRKPASIE